MGLVVVPLAAHALWRTGLVQGLPRIGLPVVLTWAILEWVLLGHTNLSLGSFELTYEDLALDFVSSPRAYILLLTGAWLGSVANLRWGWDFGGIIVPGLLALCWLQPERLLATMGEVVVLTVLVTWVGRLPLLRRANMTGGRPLVLAYTVAYLAKFMLAGLAGEAWPGFQVRQLYGFGYLLPTLMALRASKSGDLMRTMVPAMVTSFAAFCLASVVGYGLAIALPDDPPAVVLQTLDARDEPQLDALGSAWLDEAPPPGVAAAMVDPIRPSPRRDAALGGLWLRSGGQPLAVTGQLGTPGDGPALLALGAVLDARAVLICGVRGTSCRSDEVAATTGVLRVQRGADTALRVAGRIPPGLDLDALQRALPNLRLDPLGAAVPVLELSDADAWRLAAQVLGEAPGLAADLSAPGWVAEGSPEQEPGRRALLVAEVLGALMRWRAGDAQADEALQVASGLARRLGMEVGRTGDVVTLVGPNLRVGLTRAAEPWQIVLVPAADAEPDSLDLGLRLWGAQPGGVFIAEAAGLDGAPNRSASRGSQAILVGALAGSPPPAHVLEVRIARRGLYPTDTVFLALGRPLGRPGELPLASRALLTRLADAGFQPQWVDGRPSLSGLLDSANTSRAATRTALGEDLHVTVWASQRLAERMAVLDLEHPWMGPFIAAAGGRRVLAPEVLAASARRLPAAAPGSAQAALEAAAWTPDATSWSGLASAARREGMVVELLCDPVAGCRHLALTRCTATGCTGLAASAAGPGPTASEPPDTAASRAALTLSPQSFAWSAPAVSP